MKLKLLLSKVLAFAVIGIPAHQVNAAHITIPVPLDDIVKDINEISSDLGIIAHDTSAEDKALNPVKDIVPLGPERLNNAGGKVTNAHESRETRTVAVSYNNKLLSATDTQWKVVLATSYRYVTQTITKSSTRIFTSRAVDTSTKIVTRTTIVMNRISSVVAGVWDGLDNQQLMPQSLEEPLERTSKHRQREPILPTSPTKNIIDALGLIHTDAAFTVAHTTVQGHSAKTNAAHTNVPVKFNSTFEQKTIHSINYVQSYKKTADRASRIVQKTYTKQWSMGPEYMFPDKNSNQQATRRAGQKFILAPEPTLTQGIHINSAANQYPTNINGGLFSLPDVLEDHSSPAYRAQVDPNTIVRAFENNVVVRHGGTASMSASPVAATPNLKQNNIHSLPIIDTLLRTIVNAISDVVSAFLKIASTATHEVLCLRVKSVTDRVKGFLDYEKKPILGDTLINKLLIDHVKMETEKVINECSRLNLDCPSLPTLKQYLIELQKLSGNIIETTTGSIDIQSILLSSADSLSTQLSSAPDIQPTRSSSADTQPTRSSAAHVKPTRSSSANMKPTRSSSADIKPKRSSSAHSKPTQPSSAHNKQTPSSFADTQPIQYSSTDAQPIQFNSANTQPIQLSTADVQPTISSSAGIKPIKFSSADIPPFQFSSADIQPTRSSSADIKPIQFSSSGTQPAQASSADIPPIQSSSADIEPQFSFTDIRSTLLSSAANIQPIRSNPADSQPIESSFTDLQPAQPSGGTPAADVTSYFPGLSPSSSFNNDISSRNQDRGKGRVSIMTVIVAPFLSDYSLLTLTKTYWSRSSQAKASSSSIVDNPPAIVTTSISEAAEDAPTSTSSSTKRGPSFLTTSLPSPLSTNPSVTKLTSRGFNATSKNRANTTESEPHITPSRTLSTTIEHYKTSSLDINNNNDITSPGPYTAPTPTTKSASSLDIDNNNNAGPSAAPTSTAESAASLDNNNDNNSGPSAAPTPAADSDMTVPFIPFPSEG